MEEEDNTDYAPKLSSIHVDCSLEDEWIEFSYNRYSEKFLYPNDDIDYYDDLEFLCSSENDDDIFFDLLCEEMDEIFLQ